MAGAAQPVFELTGGELCLDFANTLSHRGEEGREHDLLDSYAALVAFAMQAGIVSAGRRKLLEAEARQHPRAAEAVLLQARQLREAVFDLFSAIAAGERPSAAPLETLNTWVLRASGHLQLASEGYGFQWRWTDHEPALESPLWRIARSAGDLLTSGSLHQVRVCAAGTCFWLFLDKSRNQTRRWCDMKVCGNRMKARLHYQRLRRARH